MIVKFLLLACCCAATLAQGNEQEDALTKVTADGRVKVLQVDDKIKDPTKEYLDLIQDRRESVEWEHVVQRENVNRSMATAFFKGMLRNNQFSTYRCIANAIFPTFKKINESANYVQNVTEVMLQRGLEEVRSLRLITSGMFHYVEELYERKLEELKKERDRKERDKIVESAREKMSLLGTILAEVENRAKEIKFKFFQDYIQYAYDTENYLRKTAREGAQKALKCVS